MAASHLFMSCPAADGGRRVHVHMCNPERVGGWRSAAVNAAHVLVVAGAVPPPPDAAAALKGRCRPAAEGERGAGLGGARRRRRDTGRGAERRGATLRQARGGTAGDGRCGPGRAAVGRAAVGGGREAALRRRGGGGRQGVAGWVERGMCLAGAGAGGGSEAYQTAGRLLIFAVIARCIVCMSHTLPSPPASLPARPSPSLPLPPPLPSSLRPSPPLPAPSSCPLYCRSAP